MKIKYLLLLFLLSCVYLSCGELPASSSENPRRIASVEDGTFKTGEILVKFAFGISTKPGQDIVEQMGGKRLKTFSLTQIQHIKIREGQTVEEAVKEYGKFPEVEYAEPNYIIKAEAVNPSDTNFSNLWGLHNIAQTVNGNAGTSDSDIDAPEAWEFTTGSSSVVVAVIDSGVDYNHPDLDGNIWTNSSESIDGVDNDGNGYIDDIRGWDFVENDNSPIGYNDHGTHIAGIIGAEGDNGEGVTGVAWNVMIMPVRTLDFEGLGYVSDGIAGIEYAILNGAQIINYSIGSNYFNQAVYDTISLANDSNILFVTSAGNSGVDNETVDHYPSDYDLANIIAVAATDQNDNLASFSNYGVVSVDIAAPGVDIQSTIPARETIYTTSFESGTTGWTTVTWSGYTWGYSSNFSVTGTQSFSDGSELGVNYLSNTYAEGYSPSIDLTAKSGCKLSSWLAYSTEPDNDFFYISGWNGSAWSYIDIFSGDYFYWSHQVYRLDTYEGVSSFSIKFGLLSNGI
jgi:subtilisin family serine protease